MQMVRVGGHFLSLTQCNNACGHGFYQLSPELFFRVFSPENGFVLERIYAFLWHKPQWYEVVDPTVIHRRVTLINDRVTGLLIQARKRTEVEIFSTAPQQSDYVARWETGTAGRATANTAGEDDGPIKAWLRSQLSSRQLDMIRFLLNQLRMVRNDRRLRRESTIRNRTMYKKVNMERYPEAGVSGGIS